MKNAPAWAPIMLQLIAMMATAGGVYGAIRGDLAATSAQATHALAEGIRANGRIDQLLAQGSRR